MLCSTECDCVLLLVCTSGPCAGGNIGCGTARRIFRLLLWVWRVSLLPAERNGQPARGQGSVAEANDWIAVLLLFHCAQTGRRAFVVVSHC
jgi:hypothetical protein